MRMTLILFLALVALALSYVDLTAKAGKPAECGASCRCGCNQGLPCSCGK